VKASNKLHVGDFGEAWFALKDNITRFHGFGTITFLDKNYILFKDNDDFQYHIKVGDFNFKKKDFIPK